jgi:hypothetical protein
VWHDVTCRTTAHATIVLLKNEYHAQTHQPSLTERKHTLEIDRPIRRQVRPVRPRQLHVTHIPIRAARVPLRTQILFIYDPWGTQWRLVVRNTCYEHAQIQMQASTVCFHLKPASKFQIRRTAARVRLPSGCRPEARFAPIAPENSRKLHVRALSCQWLCASMNMKTHTHTHTIFHAMLRMKCAVSVYASVCIRMRSCVCVYACTCMCRCVSWTLVHVLVLLTQSDNPIRRAHSRLTAAKL